jgi:chromate transport protein ChrA
VAATLAGSLLPSTLLTYTVARWGEQRREQRGVRAFTEGMAPVTIGLLLATSWILTEPTRTSAVGWLLFAAGSKYLLLSALLYAPGVLLYVWAKRQRHERVFSAWEWAVLAALLVLAGVAALLLATGRLAL